MNCVPPFSKAGFCALVFIFSMLGATAQKIPSLHDFANPPMEYRPVPFWHLNGNLDSVNIHKQINDAISAGFGGVTVLPVSPGDQYPTGLPCPGMSPQYLSEAYFSRYNDMLEAVKANHGQLILYDDIDFPSGSAGGKLKNDYPSLTRKVLDRSSSIIDGPLPVDIAVPKDSLMAVLVQNVGDGKMIDLTPMAVAGKLHWEAPAGQWKIIVFTCAPGPDGLVDYMDTAAVKKFIGYTYDQYAKRFSSYFRNVIKQTFFDDVGYVGMERGWTPAINQKFKERYGKDPALYYPSLWEDIGPETEAARIAFFDTRAELLAEGFPKIVSAWDSAHGLKSSGHPPGNYEIQPVDMNFDIFKFYRHAHIPTMDAIFYHGHGREGFKLVSSAAAVYDRPIVAAEIYGAFQEGSFTVNTLYQAAMEVFCRGINFLVPHGMWYDPKPTAVRIPPLISPYSEKLAGGLRAFNDFAARTAMMLRDGREVAEIGMIYPISSLEGFYHFESGDNPGVGKFAPPGTDYLSISDILTNQLQRGFTFIHPELFVTNQYKLDGTQVLLDNKINRQRYRVIILPGGKVISYYALKKLQQFYEQGGKVIAITLLPSKSAEFGLDTAVQKIIKTMFPDSSRKTTTVNKHNGKAIFIPTADESTIKTVLNELDSMPDVLAEQHIPPDSGAFSYIHKIKAGKNIYYFANSTKRAVNTTVLLRGKIDADLWDPHSGKKLPMKGSYLIKNNGIDYTRIILRLPPVTAIFVIGK